LAGLEKSPNKYSWFDGLKEELLQLLNHCTTFDKKSSVKRQSEKVWSIESCSPQYRHSLLSLMPNLQSCSLVTTIWWRNLKLCYQFRFIPFLRNNFITCNALSQMSTRIVNTPHQHHYSGYVLIYAFCGGFLKDCEAPFSLNYIRLENYLNLRSNMLFIICKCCGINFQL